MDRPDGTDNAPPSSQNTFYFQHSLSLSCLSSTPSSSLLTTSYSTVPLLFPSLHSPNHPLICDVLPYLLSSHLLSLLLLCYLLPSLLFSFSILSSIPPDASSSPAHPGFPLHLLDRRGLPPGPPRLWAHKGAPVWREGAPAGIPLPN